jgi:DNA-binding IclR family transcriptional regulator
MASIANKFDASLSLAGRVGSTMVIVQRAEAPSMLRLNFTVGTALTLERSAVGGAYFAATCDEDRAATLEALKERLSPQALGDARAWLQECCQMYSQHGYVLNLRRYHPEVCAIAVPIVSIDGKTVMSLNCGGPASRMPPELLTGPVLHELQSLARQLQQLMF